MKDTFGMSRVLEPRGAVPVTAWKIDNSRKLKAGEARIAIERIHLEKSSFEQICSQCEYDESKMIQRICDIIEKRGKLHNPFTETGGMVYGRIEEMGKDFEKNRNLKVGDEFLCLVTMTAIPVYIEKIEEIDFNYGQLTVQGYAVIFEDTTAYSDVVSADIKYTMAALEEAGSLYAVSQAAAGAERIAIVAKDVVSAMLYSGAIRKTCGRSCHVFVVMDESSCGGLPERQVESVLLSYADRVYFTDVGNAVESYEQIGSRCGPVDLVINCQEKTGSETLSIFMCRNNGTVYFTNMSNKYAAAILIAESMKKQIYAVDLDQYFEGYDSFTAELLRQTRDNLDKVNRLYEEFAAVRGVSARRAGVPSHYSSGRTEDFVYASPVTEAMVKEALNVAKYDCNVIIQGETGAGKEKVLQLIQKNCARNDKPCIKVNCATIAENLAESEFFGYEAGSFTGAQAGGKKGYFELANNGILFLDEIGTLSLSMQSKLLRVLQENQFYRVGGTRPVNVNVRVICANNLDLFQLAKEGRFREDLYYRLNICQIDVPPLRSRKEDIPVLAKEFLSRYNKKYDVLKEISPEGCETLMRYNWPGNVRELENTVHRMVINSQTNVISGMEAEETVHKNARDSSLLYAREELDFPEGGQMSFDAIIQEQEKRLVTYALKAGGTTRKAAASLGITQAKLMRIKKKYGI